MQVNFSINIDDKLLGKFKKLFSRRNVIVAVLLISTAATTVVLKGQAVTKRWTFRDGDTIFADRINDNFDELFAKVNAINVQMGGVEFIPCGTIVAFAGTSAPYGWLLCDGKSYSTSEYKDLFDKIAYTYGRNSNDFLVPDLRGRVIIGVTVDNDPMFGNDFNRIGKTEGKAEVTLTENELPKHKHELIGNSFFTFDIKTKELGKCVLENIQKTGTGGDENLTIGYTGELPDNNKPTSFVGEGNSFSIIQPSMALNYIIKY